MAASFAGLSLEEALERCKQSGLDLVYSSDLIRPEMRVIAEPQAASPRARLEEILRPHGIVVTEGPEGLLLLRRAPRPETSAKRQTPAPSVATQPLEEVIVSASQYRFARVPTAAVSLSAADLHAAPNLGDDPMRAVARVPGAATSDLSSRVWLRGGAADETLVRFDDWRLYNPFHLKDFQSMFSSIGANVVESLRIHAGGYPAQFGDRMSGVIEIEPLPVDEPLSHELALSLFNVSAVSSGRTQDGRSEWLVSGRRGNLDLLIGAIDSDSGQPKYLDFYGRFKRQLNDSLAISANALVFDDSILLFESGDEEAAEANYRDTYGWLRLDYRPSEEVSGSVLVGRGDLESRRDGRAEQEGISRGFLEDERAFTIDSLQTDWSLLLRPALLLQLGGEWRRMRGRYDYRDQMEFDVLLEVPGAVPATESEHSANIAARGEQFGAYAIARVEPTARLAADIGVRWDRETLSPDAGDHLRPRLSVLYELAERTQLRLGWGRYFQSQSIDELPVSDGVVEFSRPQRAQHAIAAVEHRYRNGTLLRVEAYRKAYRHLRPRYENLLNTFVLLPELKPDRVRVDARRAHARGVELSLSRSVSPTLQWWGNYAWSVARDDLGPTNVPRLWDQRHSLNAGAVWRNERWELGVSANLHSGWRTSALVFDDTTDTPLIRITELNGKRLNTYFSLNARVARTLRLEGASTLTVFAEVSNAFNRRNQCCVEYEVEENDAGETVFDVERLAFLPVLPSIGVVWRF